jgi:hypothetical protein
MNHYFKINDHSNLNSSVMVQFGKIGNSNLDYQNANSPDPTYFRKLPSYYSSMYGKDGEYSGAFTPDNENAEKSRLQFFSKPQIETLYQANQNPVIDSNGNIMAMKQLKVTMCYTRTGQTIKRWWPLLILVRN